jgi:hypothetical protein
MDADETHLTQNHKIYHFHLKTYDKRQEIIFMTCTKENILDLQLMLYFFVLAISSNKSAEYSVTMINKVWSCVIKKNPESRFVYTICIKFDNEAVIKVAMHKNEERKADYTSPCQ